MAKKKKRSKPSRNIDTDHRRQRRPSNQNWLMNRNKYEDLRSLQVKAKKRFKRTENKIKKVDRKVDRLKRPRFYVKRNYLGIPVAVKMSNLTKTSSRINKIKYATSLSPKRILICARRYIRREVLFAKGGIGNGKRVKPYRKFTEDSRIKC